MPRLHLLPETILTVIFEYVLQTDDCLSLLAICKPLRAVAEDIIYREITLDYKHAPDPSYRLHRLLRTLLSRRDLAERIRYLSLDCVNALFSLSSDAKEPERRFLRGLGLEDEEAWLEALESDVAGLYAAVVVLLTPNLIELTLRVRDGFEFTNQVVDPAFHTPGTGTRTLWSLRSLTYGSGMSNTDTTSFLEEYPVRHVSPLFYLPSLTSLSLTGVGGGRFSWPTGRAPRSNLIHLDISGAWLDVDLLDEILSACPRLESVGCFVDDRENSKLDVYGSIGKALSRVQSTIKDITIRYYDVHQSRFFEPEPDPAVLETAVLHRLVDVQPVGSFAQFTQLERLVLPVVAYLGGEPDQVPKLKTGLPSTLSSLSIMDDTWIVLDNVSRYWSTMFDHLTNLLDQKHTSALSLRELSLWVHDTSVDDFDFEKPYQELQALGEEVGVKVSFWTPYDP